MACSSGGGPQTTTTGATGSGVPAGTTVGTPGATVPDTPHVRCEARSDNVLLIDCVALLPSESPGAAFLQEPTGALRALDVTQIADELLFTVWRLNAQTTYTVRVQPASGPELQTEFTTAAIPAEHAIAPIVTGSPSFSHLLIPHQCDGGPNMILLDEQGEIVWYVAVAATGMTGAGFAAVDGFDITPDGVVAVVGRTRVRQWTWTGDLVMDLGWPAELPGPVHHDVVHRDGDTYVLTAEQVVGQDGLNYVMDGFLVFDAAHDLVAEWSLSDVYAPSGGILAPGGFWGTFFPNSWDWAHSNGIDVDPNGDLLFSSRSFDTILKIRGDWAEPDFGQVAWALSADPYSVLGSDFSFDGSIAPGDFMEQHHPNLDAQGRMHLFDNRAFGFDSRATRWQLDELGMTATLQAAWSLGEACSVQGSVFGLGNDNAVATCASSQTVYEFSPASADPTWSITVPCADSPTRPLVVRGYPLDFIP